MRSLLALTVIALLVVGVGACGNNGKAAGSASARSGSASAKRTLARDYDSDGDVDPSSHYDNDLYFGQEASAGERQSVTRLVDRYYVAAAMENGAMACSLLDSRLAGEIPEVYGQSPPGPPGLSGKTCAVVMSKLFKQRHHQLIVDRATLTVTGVLVEGKRGLVLLRFRAMPKRHVFVDRERGLWKVNELLDAGPPQPGN
jgi:hypothetical protein